MERISSLVSPLISTNITFDQMEELLKRALGEKRILMEGLNELRFILQREGNVSKQELMSIITKTLTKTILYERDTTNG